jgi:protein-L-isoaspartate O-methyltransferase
MEAGAGVGYYVAQVLEALPLSIGLALDLSKYAVRRAARAHARLDAVVTDLRERLPVRSGVVDVALNVFAPRPASELFRTLNRDGRLIGHFRRNTTLRVLALTHRNPARAWTIASLAEEALEPHVRCLRSASAITSTNLPSLTSRAGGFNWESRCCSPPAIQ